jgi:phosphate transport system protein
MADQAVAMLRGSLDAFIGRDAQKARFICSEDDEVDRLYDKTYQDLIQRMIEDPGVITRATYLMWAAHNVERIGDRATNISESVVYLVTGSTGELEVSRY